MQIAGGELPLGWTAAARVVVGANDAEEARALAVEFDETTAHEPRSEDPDEPQPDAEWSDWPQCPACQARRPARCPVCQAAGTRFPLADVEEAAGQARVLLYCGSCDDHFRPDFFRVCHQCGHDFGTGIEPVAPQAIAEETRRMWLVAGAMIIAGAALAGYFAWVMR
ncbi:MAG: hypothetical protein SFU86_09540 [Pirellulaceae bacterium]|nr:hypothetical protein [Pirellulaceae bacterium]